MNGFDITLEGFHPKKGPETKLMQVMSRDLESATEEATRALPKDWVSVVIRCYPARSFVLKGGVR